MIKTGEPVFEEDLVPVVGEYFLALNSAMKDVIGESIEPTLTEGDIATMAHDLFVQLKKFGVTNWPELSQLQSLDLELPHKTILIGLKRWLSDNQN